MRKVLTALVMGALLAAPGSRAAEDTPFVVIVRGDHAANSIKRQELVNFFLKKTSRWSDGRMVVPVDQTASAPARNAFTRSVLSAAGLGQLSAVQNFWLQQVYSGRSTPPEVKASDAEVVAFVASTPGAIGYVSAAPAAGGVKVLTVTD
jgi:ABC-type phosphate transport system substrate-binding protein